MNTKTVNVPAISCSHCTNTIQMEVGEVEGVTNVQADETTKQVTVEWEGPASWGEIQALLEEINFPAAG